MKTSDLTQADQKRLEEAIAIVERQEDALDEVRGPLLKLVEHGKDKLNARDIRTIRTIMNADLDEILEPNTPEGVEPMPLKARINRTLKPPFAFFYTKAGGKDVKVLVESGSAPRVIDEDDPDFD
jgi:hypothetical protein